MPEGRAITTPNTKVFSSFTIAGLESDELATDIRLRRVTVTFPSQARPFTPSIRNRGTRK